MLLWIMNVFMRGLETLAPAPKSPRAFIPQTPFCARAKNKNSLRQSGKILSPRKIDFPLCGSPN